MAILWLLSVCLLWCLRFGWLVRCFWGWLDFAFVGCYNTVSLLSGLICVFAAEGFWVTGFCGWVLVWSFCWF